MLAIGGPCIPWSLLERIPPDAMEPLSYLTNDSGNSLTASAGDQSSEAFKIEGSHDFICTAINRWDADGPDSTNWWKAKIINGSSPSRAWANEDRFFHKDLFGTGQNPGHLVFPTLIQRGSDMQVVFENGTANAKTVGLQFQGLRLHIDIVEVLEMAGVLQHQQKS